MRPLALFALIGLSMAVVLAVAPGSRGQEQLTLAVDVDLVLFNVMVTDSRDRYASGLKVSDFQIREDGRSQDITLFEAEDISASVGLIIDNSGSMGHKRRDVVEAAIEFAAAGNPEDEMFVVNFNENVSLGLPPGTRFTNDLRQIRAALFRAAPAGRTALYDALAVGLEHLESGARIRKALVVLSDGGDNASARKLDDVLQAARRSRVTIYTIGIYDNASSDRNPAALRRIAKSSGGRAYFPGSLDDMGQVWLDIAGAIRNQYTIGYTSSNSTRDGAYRKVEITARSSGGRRLRVIARNGYFAPEAH